MELKVCFERAALAACVGDLVRRHPAPDLGRSGSRTVGRLQLHLAWTAAAPSAVEGALDAPEGDCDARPAGWVFDLYRRKPDLFRAEGLWEELAAGGAGGDAPAPLKDLAGGMIRGYGGCGARLLAAAKGRIGGRRGLRARLLRLPGFAPEDSAKADLFPWMLAREGMFAPADPGSARFPLTGALLRRLVRDGAVRVPERSRRWRRRFPSREGGESCRGLECLSRALGRIPGTADLDPWLGELRPPPAAP